MWPPPTSPDRSMALFQRSVRCMNRWTSSGKGIVMTAPEENSLKGHSRDDSLHERDPLWRRILILLLSVLLFGVFLFIGVAMFLLYFDGPR